MLTSWEKPRFRGFAVQNGSASSGLLNKISISCTRSISVNLVEIHQCSLPNFSGWRNLGFCRDQAPALHHRFCNASALSRVVTSGLLHDLQDLRSWNFPCQIRGWNPSMTSPCFKRFYYKNKLVPLKLVYDPCENSCVPLSCCLYFCYKKVNWLL